MEPEGQSVALELMTNLGQLWCLGCEPRHHSHSQQLGQPNPHQNHQQPKVHKKIKMHDILYDCCINFVCMIAALRFSVAN